MKIDWTKPTQYVTPPPHTFTWWERGLVRYAVLSYSLWTRNVLIDLGVMKKKVKK